MPESEERQQPQSEMNPPETVPAPQAPSQEMPANAQPAEALPPDKPVNIEDLDAAVLANSRRHTRRSFAIAAAAAAAGYGLYRWIEDGPRDADATGSVSRRLPIQR